MDISVVVPVYGCPEALDELHRRLSITLDSTTNDYEIVLVDDCCPLGSWSRIEAICQNDTRVKGLRLARNFGQGQAITAGLQETSGEWVITMDCDLQDIPENIPILFSKAREGYDVVFVRRRARKDSFITQLWARVFHKLFSYLAELDFDFDLGTYLIASRRAADMFCLSKDRGRDFGMYLMWLGYKRSFVEMEHGNRHSGRSAYTFWKKMKYAKNVITTFSNRVLYIPIIAGFIFAGLSLLYIIYLVIAYFLIDNPIGWTSLAASIFLVGGIQLSTIGVVGLYIGNIFDVTKDRPLYVIQEKRNC